VRLRVGLGVNVKMGGFVRVAVGEVPDGVTVATLPKPDVSAPRQDGLPVTGLWYSFVAPVEVSVTRSVYSRSVRPPQKTQ
jgi:hypothetical protein